MKAGFVDIEDGEDYLKDWHSIRFQKNYSKAGFEENQRYWQLASQLLHDYPFVNKNEKKMWQLYIDGKTFRTISKVTHRSTATISRTIARISKVIKL